MPWLPAGLPDWQAATRWTAQCASAGVGGVMVAGGRVVIGGRNVADSHDVFEARDADTGELLWSDEVESRSNFDYGNAPRATPTLVGGLVVTCGAAGTLSGLDAATGVPLWRRSLSEAFAAPPPIWGFAGSPLITDDAVVVTPGAADASMVAIDLFTGQTRWKSAGAEAVYASPLPVTLPTGGESIPMIVSVDQLHTTLRRADTGAVVQRWQAGGIKDFGVPSPVLAPDRMSVVLTSESRGVQRFALTTAKASRPVAVAVNESMLPDSHTPVAAGGRLLVAWEGFSSLAADDLSTQWTIDDAALFQYASVIATADRALVTCENGQVLLIEHAATGGEIIDRWQLPTDRLLSHPAIVGDRLYIRFGNQLRCIELN